jgi:hypothetical protein
MEGLANSFVNPPFYVQGEIWYSKVAKKEGSFRKDCCFQTLNLPGLCQPGLCWMMRGTASLSADVRPSLLSLAERGLGTPKIRRSLRSSPHYL